MGIQDLADKYRRLSVSTSDVSRILSDNFREVWNTQGRSINTFWGRQDLVGTGTLRSLMTSSSSYLMRDGKILIDIPSQYLFVNQKYRFLGVSTENLDSLAALFSGRKS